MWLLYTFVILHPWVKKYPLRSSFVRELSCFVLCSPPWICLERMSFVSTSWLICSPSRFLVSIIWWIVAINWFKWIYWWLRKWQGCWVWKLYLPSGPHISYCNIPYVLHSASGWYWDRGICLWKILEKWSMFIFSWYFSSIPCSHPHKGLPFPPTFAKTLCLLIFEYMSVFLLSLSFLHSLRIDFMYMYHRSFL